MNSEELHDICAGHEGKPWWPELLHYDWNLHGPKRVRRWYCDSASLTPDHAADLILGSAVRWLVGHDDLYVGPPMATDGGYIASIRNSKVEEARTLLAAVLAACKAVETQP